MDVQDVRAVREGLDRLLAVVEAGEVECEREQRLRLEGARDALRELENTQSLQ